MKILQKLFWLFWNKDENRSRALWRMAVHLLTWSILSGILQPVLVLLFNAFMDALKNGWAEFPGSGQPIDLFSNSWINFVILPVATCLAILLATYFVGRWVDRRKFREFGFHFSKTWWLDFGFGLVLGAGLMGGIFLFGLLTGTMKLTGYFQSYLDNVHFSLGLVQFMILFVQVGIYEEVLSRGYYFVNLAEGLNLGLIGKRNAVILTWAITSIAFGLLHLSNPNATWISTTMIMVAGLFLGLGMVLTGSLAIPIGVHISWNFFQGNIFGFPVSGMQTGVSIFVTESTGPEWLTGGAFGPEAGVMGLAAMVVGSLLTLLWVHRKGSLHFATDLAVYNPPAEEKVLNP